MTQFYVQLNIEIGSALLSVYVYMLDASEVFDKIQFGKLIKLLLDIKIL